MNKKAETQKSIITLLKRYFDETPTTLVEREILAINKKKFEGTTAKDYFANFHYYYLGLENKDKKIVPTRVATSVVASAIS